MADMMKALMAKTAGEADVLAIVEVAVPEPGPGQVLIKVSMSALNFADVAAMRGKYARQGGFVYPAFLGIEAMGTVAGLGDGVSQFQLGQRVVAFTLFGSHSEYAVAPAGMTYPVPASVDAAQAAAFPVVGLTAYHLLKDAARATAGDSLLITAAAGGVGTTLIQMARQLGLAPVYAAAGSQPRVDYAVSFGATAGIDYTSGLFADQLVSVTGKRGIDLVIDSVGGSVRHDAMQAMNVLGRIVAYGNASGDAELAVSPAALRARSQGLMTFNLAAFRTAYPERVQAAAEVVLDWIGRGLIKVDVEAVIPFSAGADAFRRLADRQVRGKLLLSFGE